MMIKINILPNAEKERRKLSKKIGAVLRFGFSVVLVLVVLSGILFSAQISLEMNYKLVKSGSEDRRQDSDKKTEAAEIFLEDMNSVSKKINKTSEEIPRWSKFFIRIARECPDGIRLNDIQIEKEHVKIAGFAKTRESFLGFQEKLRSEEIKNMTSPVSNVVSPRDFNFEMEFDLDKKYLNQP